ncbi:hypothetical protein L7F22_055492 [Adiantum nelumboides]|nr:hypothetical protein [Adiantum nelumboides]
MKAHPSKLGAVLQNCRIVLVIVLARLANDISSSTYNGFVQLVYCRAEDEGYMGYIGIGNFTPKAAEKSAVAKLSQGNDQQSWWTLADTAWHDSAITRFFEAGPLQAHEMAKLADLVQDVNTSSNPWLRSGINISTDGKLTDITSAVRSLSTATYTMNKTVKGTGTIVASMWTIFFQCELDKACDEGYLVPFVLTQAIPVNTAGTLWLQATSNLLVNAIPSFIHSLSNSSVQSSCPPIDADLSVVINAHENIPQCPVNSAFVAYRSHLEASYGILPATTCTLFAFARDDSPTSFRLLIASSLPDPSDVSVLRDDNSNQTTENFLDKLGVKRAQWQSRPFEECMEEALLVIKWISKKDTSWNMPTVCRSNVCVDVWSTGSEISNLSTTIACNHVTWQDNKTINTDGLEWLKFLQLVASLSNSCRFVDPPDGKLTASDIDDWPAVVCQVSDHVHFTATVRISPSNISRDLSSYQIISRKSTWTSSRGLDTHEFKYAPRNMSAACTRDVSSTLLNCSTSPSSFFNVIQIHARTSLHRFLWEHTMAFTVEKGPATDVKGFLALLLSTATSVMFAFAGPGFTNFLVRITCGRRPQLFDSSRHHGRILVLATVLMFAGCNMLLSFLSFLPVLYVAWSEMEREEPFDTWDLGSEDVYVDRSNLQLRVISLLSATSKYKSHFINLSVAVALTVCLVVLGFTAWRVKKFLNICSQLRMQERGRNPESIPLMAMEMTNLDDQMREAAAVVAESNYKACDMPQTGDPHMRRFQLLARRCRSWNESRQNHPSAAITRGAPSSRSHLTTDERIPIIL